MDPSSSKNPKKKRRVDDQLDSEPGPSSEVLPLVAPHLVKKSSKDPNRGLYPFRKPVKLCGLQRHSPSQIFQGITQKVNCKDDLQSRSESVQGEQPTVSNPTLPSQSSKSDTALQENFSSPQFVKASELRRRMLSIHEQPPAANPTLPSQSSKSDTVLEENYSSPQFVKASELRRRMLSIHEQPPAANPTFSSEKIKSDAALGENISSLQFVKASELPRRMPQEIQSKSQSTDSAPMSTNSNSVSEEDSSLDRNVAEVISGVERARKTFTSWELSLEKRKYRSKFKHIGAASKITKYFKTGLPPSKLNAIKAESRLLKSASASKSQCEASTSQSNQTSGCLWSQKDESMSEILAERDNEQFFKNYNDCYGLVDNSVPESTGKDYFSVLPIHIIETILCQIPILDLVTCRLVCSRWCEIIDGEKFMEWKKFYYQLKYHSSTIMKWKMKLDAIFEELHYTYTIEDGLRFIVKYMEVGFNRVPSEDMFNLLMKNPKGELADQVLSERFPEHSNKEKRVWCQFAIALLISETVWDIFNLYKSLFTTKSTCSRVDVTDAMYCVATFLLYFRIDQGLNLGLHYRLYYAIYLIENHVPRYQREKLKIIQGLPGQQSMANYGKLDCSFLTYEQIRILNHKFGMNQKIRIVALAGTGKTSTLLYLAKLYPQIKFLNLVFNKSVNDEAKKKFPQNVTCKTAHSLAYSAVGKFLKHKLTSTLRPYDLINHLKYNDQQIQIYAYANLVLSTITNFTLSSATVMGIIHVPTKDFNRKSISITHQNNILKDAFKIWMMMLDRRNPFKITHDVYLKLYHLKRPKLNKYQCIMVDEAQDCNPVILDIVLSQTMPVIFVGDPNQQIYGFRGAQNALENIGATHTYHLTKSFRFGPEISYIAHCILDCLLSKTSTTIVGNTGDSYFNGKVGGQYAVIARTNVVLFNEALRMVVFKRLKAYEPTVINAAFAGGFNSYGFDQISDIYRLKSAGGKNDKPVADKFISRFKLYSDLVNYARYSDDSDLLSKIEIVNQHGKDITKFISILKERCNHSIDTANVVFSTAHKSKGLEFDTVYLTDDYPISTVPGYLDAETSREEAHILYVAVTRAKKHLLMQEKLNKVLHLAYEKFEYPVSSKSVLQDKASLRCVQCDTSFKPHTVLMYMRRKVVMASGREIQEGPLCMKCGSDPEMRPDVHVNGLIMYLDAIRDNAHCFLSPIVGPLPGDPPIVHDRFAEFQNADRVFVINLNIH